MDDILNESVCRIDVIVLNAGIVLTVFDSITEQGYSRRIHLSPSPKMGSEVTSQLINYFGHFPVVRLPLPNVVLNSVPRGFYFGQWWWTWQWVMGWHGMI